MTAAIRHAVLGLNTVCVVDIELRLIAYCKLFYFISSWNLEVINVRNISLYTC